MLALQVVPDFTSIPDPPPGLQAGAAPLGATRKLASVTGPGQPASPSKRLIRHKGMALGFLRRCPVRRLLLYRRIRADAAGLSFPQLSSQHPHPVKGFAAVAYAGAHCATRLIIPRISTSARPNLDTDASL